MDWFRQVNIAPWRYRNILSQHDTSPFRLIEVGPLGSNFQACAFLKDGLRDPYSDRFVLYGRVDGYGVSKNQHVAVWKAISEGLERWAWADLRRSGPTDQCGMGVNPTTDGFAAFPGLFLRSARQAALAEAFERWSLMAWWEGLLPHVEMDSTSIAIASDTLGLVTSIVWRVDGSSKLVAYGFGAGRSIDSARERAAVELETNSAVLRSWDALGRSCALSARQEKRLTFFAGRDGFELFRAKVAAPKPLAGVEPQMAFDGVVHGPWLDFASVWRCVFKPVSDAFVDDSRPDVFWF